MSQSQQRTRARAGKNAGGEAGFTLMEVMVALVVLTIGLMSIALLMATVYKQAVRSRYASVASMLASEKLEDLSSFGASDPRAHLAGGVLTSAIGSVGAPVSASWNSSTVTVDYYDTVTISNTGTAACGTSVTGSGGAAIGAMNETFEVLSGSTAEYVSQCFTADGLLHWYSGGSGPYYYPSQLSTTAPTGETYLRTWQIQSNTPVSSLTTITVLVSLIDTTMNPPVSFQMSTVRP